MSVNYSKYELDNFTKLLKERYDRATLGKFCGLIVVKIYQANKCLASIAFKKLKDQNLYFLKDDWTILDIDESIINSFLNKVKN